MLKQATNEAVGWRGEIEIVIFDLDGKIRDRVKFSNLITDLGLNQIRDAYLDFTDQSEPEFLAFGSDDTAPANGDTQLGDEFGRVPITDTDAGGIGVAITRAFISSLEGNEQVIEELGWFADADDEVNDGVLLARVLFNRNKTDLESILVTRTDTFGRL